MRRRILSSYSWRALWCWAFKSSICFWWSLCTVETTLATLDSWSSFSELRAFYKWSRVVSNFLKLSAKSDLAWSRCCSRKWNLFSHKAWFFSWFSSNSLRSSSRLVESVLYFSTSVVKCLLSDESYSFMECRAYWESTCSSFSLSSHSLSFPSSELNFS